MTLGEALTQTTRTLAAAGIEPTEARSEARLLVAHAAQVPREHLFTRDHEPLTPDAGTTLADWATRRARREPLAYLLGERDFYGLTFRVTPAVLIPRPETEFLVEAALRHLGTWPEFAPHVADVGTGSGCIAVAVAKNAPHARVWASDVSSDAANVARDNAERLGVADRVIVEDGDLLTPLVSAAPLAAIVSNPPYIAPDEIAVLAPEVRDFEPRLALGTHTDPLHFYRRLAREAPPLLMPGGLLAVEVGQGQADDVQTLWHDAGLQNVSTVRDMAGIERVVQGINPA